MAYLNIDFFARDTIAVAKELIGATLLVGTCAGRIVETEAYTTDAASHAFRRTNRSALMFDTYGHLYIYLSYGMYYCLNFTTERVGVGAVLIRAVEPTRGIPEMMKRRQTEDVKTLTNGPGKLAQAFGLDLNLNGEPIGRSVKIRPRNHIPRLTSSSRIGISKATELEWRFFESGNSFVSHFPFRPLRQA